MEKQEQTFTLGTSCHGMPCIEITNPTEKIRNFLRNAVLENRVNESAYIAKRYSTPFLQSDHDDYILIEFWGKDPTPFMDWLNINVDSIY